jgi:hypothetical protein
VQAEAEAEAEEVVKQESESHSESDSDVVAAPEPAPNAKVVGKINWMCCSDGGPLPDQVYEGETVTIISIHYFIFILYMGN